MQSRAQGFMGEFGLLENFGTLLAIFLVVVFVMSFTSIVAAFRAVRTGRVRN